MNSGRRAARAIGRRPSSRQPGVRAASAVAKRLWLPQPHLRPPRVRRRHRVLHRFPHRTRARPRHRGSSRSHLAAPRPHRPPKARRPTLEPPPRPRSSGAWMLRRRPPDLAARPTAARRRHRRARRHRHVPQCRSCVPRQVMGRASRQAAAPPRSESASRRRPVRTPRGGQSIRSSRTIPTRRRVGSRVHSSPT
jgi:hypothetical protein